MQSKLDKIGAGFAASSNYGQSPKTTSANKQPQISKPWIIGRNGRWKLPFKMALIGGWLLIITHFATASHSSLALIYPLTPSLSADWHLIPSSGNHPQLSSPVAHFGVRWDGVRVGRETAPSRGPLAFGPTGRGPIFPVTNWLADGD